MAARSDAPERRVSEDIASADALAEHKNSSPLGSPHRDCAQPLGASHQSRAQTPELFVYALALRAVYACGSDSKRRARRIRVAWLSSHKLGRAGGVVLASLVQLRFAVCWSRTGPFPATFHFPTWLFFALVPQTPGATHPRRLAFGLTSRRACALAGLRPVLRDQAAGLEWFGAAGVARGLPPPAAMRLRGA